MSQSPYDIWAKAEKVRAVMGVRHLSDAEQAKQTGGLVALYPREDDAAKLAIPGGEPPEDLHLTLVYLGEDISDLSFVDSLTQNIAALTGSYTVIDARVMGHAVFNPDQEQCAVYLVGDATQLADLHDDMDKTAQVLVPDLPAQHVPFIPHITAGYDLDPQKLSYVGPVLFDRIGLSVRGQTHFFPLLGATTGPYSA